MWAAQLPAFGAVRHGLLHIIDFCHAPLILPLVLAFDGIRKVCEAAGKMHLNSDGHEVFIVRCSTLRTFGDYIL